jgi:hypothetical protein
VLTLKVRLPIFDFHGSKLAAQYLDDEVAASAGWLQKSGVDAFGLVFQEIEHGFHHPSRGEYLAMVGDALFGLNKTHVLAVAVI